MQGIGVDEFCTGFQSIFPIWVVDDRDRRRSTPLRIRSSRNTSIVIDPSTLFSVLL